MPWGARSCRYVFILREKLTLPDKVTCITKAVCSLHNYLKITEASNTASNRPYCPPGYTDQEDRDGNFIPGDWRQEVSGLKNIPHNYRK